MVNIISRLKKSGLAGRGGGCFPAWKKWQMVKEAEDKVKYVICNASEGEPGVKKDYYILKNYPQQVVNGMKIAIDFFMAEKAFLYLNHDYYKKLYSKLIKLISNSRIKIIKKNYAAGYIGGEETALINYIEKKRVEPRIRPPFPTTRGLWECPTLVNNVETFYSIGLIAAEQYEHKRFYTINGDCLWNGVYEYPEDWAIEKVLKTSKNFPDFNFFIQVGGDASGEVLNKKQLKRPVSGSGSITIYSMYKHEPLDLMKKWINFFVSESCGQCTPCREGSMRIKELLYEKNPEWNIISNLLDNLSETSFCGLGCAVSIPFRSFVKNVLAFMPDSNIGLSKIQKKKICDCFSKHS
ncbi:MAG: NADH-ubiquinone oxidoreductase-F iron-sulfur binding region domain-containing protein [Patescibacteria group bacterium]|nr:NADH-ubiquinone oxidoreductase-F iron-sulfur binding region domain-containing protein [Patescibacteria group bacterium]